ASWPDDGPDRLGQAASRSHSGRGQRSDRGSAGGLWCRDVAHRSHGGGAVLMLDYNHRPGIAERVNAAIDAALIAEREATPPRSYLGASRLGHACERALQFEFAGAPRDEGADFGGQTLRIFEIGHQ